MSVPAAEASKHSREVRADVAGIAKVQRADGRGLSAAPTPFFFLFFVRSTLSQESVDPRGQSPSSSWLASAASAGVSK